ncbi:NAD(P)H-dependent oxidoreductase [Sulfuriflexus mobilis]|uniref:NAD(P)H-dependent oxidoreductase n=1 Tax=Sulfuriflexus mobilis TaxID=1811807 RepID=UPI000F83B010|nr:NAD(P)H-dependent oxidoreductase [Sulfuriflexus mobilis]
MKVTIISGSHRPQGQSHKVAAFIQQTLLAGICEECAIVSLADNPLPLWDQGVWEGDEKWDVLLTPIREELAGSDAFVVISPEWHGQVPAGLKNFFLLFGKNELGHKPALIVTVSSGDGGAYPVAELRMSSYKNSRLCYIPEQIILRKVESVLNKDPADNDERSNSYYRERISWALNILKAYAGALAQVRESGVTQTDTFNNGM